MKSTMDVLIQYRETVSINSDTLFVLSNERSIMPNESINLMKKKIKLIKPEHLTNNGFWHQAATFSNLHSTHPQYQDYLASLLGHTLSVHKKHYDLPTDVLQKIMVCPILNNIMTGKKGNQKSSNPSGVVINMDEDELNPPQFTENETDIHNPERNETYSTLEKDNFDDCSDDDSEEELKNCDRPRKIRWTEKEKEIVFTHFGQKILRKENVKRGEINKFLKANKKELKNRTTDQLYILFVRNHVLRQQLDVTPKVKKFCKR